MSPPFGGSSAEVIVVSSPPDVQVAPRDRAVSVDAGLPASGIVLGLLATFLALAMTMHRAGLAIDPWSASIIPYYGVGLLAIAARIVLPQTRWPHAQAVADGASYYGVFTFIALMGAVSCYPVSALTHGYSDARLQGVDAFFGFDWLAWYRVVADSPVLQRLGVIAYRSIYLSPAILLGHYALAGRRADAHRFILTFWVCAVITLLIFATMPAVGPFSYLWHGPIRYMPESELWQPDLIPQLRARTVHFVDLGQLRGLVSAPSFHAAAGVLYIAAAWRIARLRWPLLGINAAMLIATPVEGTHYLADILLGMLVAIVSLAIVDRFWSGRPRTAA